MSSIPEKRAAWIQPVSEKIDSYRLEFQGSLVKVVRLPLLGWVNDRDHDKLEKQVWRETIDAVRSGRIPMENVVADGFGKVQLVKMPDWLRGTLYRAASEKLLAAENASKR